MKRVVFLVLCSLTLSTCTDAPTALPSAEETAVREDPGPPALQEETTDLSVVLNLLEDPLSSSILDSDSPESTSLARSALDDLVLALRAGQLEAAFARLADTRRALTGCNECNPLTLAAMGLTLDHVELGLQMASAEGGP